MQLDRTPQPEQVWQHSKGNDYKILLVTKNHIEEYELNKLDIQIENIKHSETGYICSLGYSDGQSQLIYDHDIYIGSFLVEPHIIYQRVDLAVPQVWARPLDNFLELVRPDLSNFCERFTRIK